LTPFNKHHYSSFDEATRLVDGGLAAEG